MNLFIAGVGNVELFKGKESVLVSKTLVDSSISLSVSLEDIRAGQGAKLYGKYAHSSGMSMKLTDAMFRMEFLAANIGSDIETGGSAVAQVPRTVTGGKVTFGEVKPLPIYPGSDKRVWIGKPGEAAFVLFPDLADDATEVEVGDYFKDGEDVCLRYIKSNDAGETLTVSANFIPDTLTAVLTAPLFAGDASNVGVSTKVGTLTITIPRFMLNGTTDLSMSMTGASQMALEGNALAVESANCDGDGYYAVISKVIEGAKLTDDLNKIAVAAFDSREEALAAPIVVKGMFEGKGVRNLPSDAVTMTSAGEGFKYDEKTGMLTLTAVTETEVTVTVKGTKPEITTKFTIPAQG